MSTPSSFRPWPFVLATIFGILVMWLDFGDTFPLSNSVGNLDQIFGHSLWYATEAFVVVASVVVFLLFGKVLYDAGKSEREGRSSGKQPSFLTAKSLVPLLVYALLLILIDIDDVVKALGLHSNLIETNLSQGYWLPVQAIYPLGSMIALVLFGRACYEIGKHG